LVSQSANCHPTISHGFLKAVQIAVAPEQPLEVAVVPDALPAAVAARTDVAPALVGAAADTYYVLSFVAEQA
jgi:hypothetical protein